MNRISFTPVHCWTDWSFGFKIGCSWEVKESFFLFDIQIDIGPFGFSFQIVHYGEAK